MRRRSVRCVLSLLLALGAAWMFAGMSGRVVAQSCEPNPCGSGQICTCDYQFGPDGEVFCNATCATPITCNFNGACDGDETRWTCSSDCPCTTGHSCSGYCGTVGDGCGGTLNCAPCPPGCGPATCGSGELCTLGTCYFGPDGEVFCTPTCIPNPQPTPTPSPAPTPTPTPSPSPPPGTNLPPVAEAGGPYNGQSLTPILFDASGSSDPNGTETITQYAWNFGDATGQGQGRFIQHVYFSNGSYPVSLTVTDSGGLSASDQTSASVVTGSAAGRFTSTLSLTQSALIKRA